MLETLFKSIQDIDEKVFTPELKEKMDNMFNEAVNTKAELIAKELVEAKEKELQEQLEQQKNKLNESFNNYATEYKTDLAKNVDAFLNTVVENFVKEQEGNLNKLLESYKTSAILQLFEKSTNILGKDLVQVLDPSCNEDSNLSKYNSLKTEFNSLSEEKLQLVKENQDLKEKLVKTICAAILAEKSHSLTVPQQESFSKLVEMYNQSIDPENFDVKEYSKKLDEIYSTLTEKKDCESQEDSKETEDSKESKESEKEDSKESKESEKEDSLKESFRTKSRVNQGSSRSWSRFI